MRSDDFEHIVFFKGESADAFSIFRAASKARANASGRAAIELALRSKKSIKKLFKEMPGDDSVFVFNTSNSRPSNIVENSVVPLPKLEAIGVRRLSQSQIAYLEDHGATIVPNEEIRPLLAVRREGRSDVKVNRSAAWQIRDVLGDSPRSGGGRGVRVGIVDTGISLAHKEFKRKRIVATRVRGHRVEAVKEDKLDHGTSVASLVVGNGLGLAPDAEIAVCDAFEADKAKALDILHAIAWLLDNPFGDGRGVDIINLSLGIAGYNEIFRNRIAEAVTFDGVLFVAAIGNDGHREGPCCSPASYAEVLSVGAYDQGGFPAAFSNCGRAYQDGPLQPDIWAPGVGVYAATASGRYDALDGTSFASPMAAAVAARLIQSRRELKGKPIDIINQLVSLSVPVPALLGNPIKLRCGM